MSLRSNTAFAICTSPLINLFCPRSTPRPKKMHSLCFLCLLGITVLLRVIENNAYAKCVFFRGGGWGGGTKRCIMGDVQAANGNYYYYSSLILRKTASLERAIVAKTNWKGKEKKKTRWSIQEEVGLKALTVELISLLFVFYFKFFCPYLFTFLFPCSPESCFR